MARKKQSLSPDPDLIRVIGLVFIFIFGIALGLMAMGTFMRTAPLFKVREVAVAVNIQPIDLPELMRLKGQNIFAVDLDKAEDRVHARYPQLSDLRVTRRFPDQIFVSGFKREVFARASFDGKLYVIDPDGFVIGAPQSGQDALPLIKGLKRQKAFSGGLAQDERVKAASSVIAFFRQDQRLAVLGLNEVNVADLTRLVCGVGGKEARFDVIIDKDNIQARLKAFAEVVARGGLDLAAVKYIDFRFGAPVIGQKKVKK